MIVNLLTRFGLLSVLDVMICVFVSLNSAAAGAYDDDRVRGIVDQLISWIFVVLFSCFVLFIIGHGGWRYHKAKNAKVFNDFNVNGYVATMYEGVNMHHPENTTLYQLIHIARHVTFAYVIVFWYE
jgi:hypothetical protein